MTDFADPTSLIATGNAARRLGIADKTLRRWCARREFPHYIIGRELRFDPAEIDTYLEAARREAV